MDLKSNVNNDILHVSFNQDNTCLAVGTQTGFFVCDTNPLNLRFTRRTKAVHVMRLKKKISNFESLIFVSRFCWLLRGSEFDEGIGIVEMLFRCNILALVGGGNRPRYQPNCVMIWDDHQERKIAELEFRSPVKAVKMRRDRYVQSPSLLSICRPGPAIDITLVHHLGGILCRAVRLSKPHYGSLLLPSKPSICC